MNNGRWIFYAIALLLILLMGVTLLWSVLNQQERPAALSQPQGVLWTGLAPPIDLAVAEQQARAAALAWAADAALMRVEATWRPVGEWVQTESPPVSWAYYYYAPSQGAVLPLSVRGEQLFTTPAVAVPGEPRTLAVFPPPTTVEMAWLSFRAAGGEEFLKAHEGAAVHMQLQATTEGDQWRITAFTPEANIKVTIDAATGLVINP